MRGGSNVVPQMTSSAKVYAVSLKLFLLCALTFLGAACSGTDGGDRAGYAATEPPVPELTATLEVGSLTRPSVVVGPDTIVVRGGQQGTIISAAVSRATGDTRWVIERPGSASGGDHSVVTSQVYIEDRGATMHVYDIETGDFMWRTEEHWFVRARGDYVIGEDDSGHAAPAVTYDATTGAVVHEQAAFELTSEFGYVHTPEQLTKKIDLETAETIWETPGFVTFPIGDYDSFIVQNGRSLERLDMETGETLWQREFEQRLNPRFTSDHRHVLVLGDRFEVLDGATGETLWSGEKPEGGRTSITDRTIVMTNGTFVDYTGDGDDVDGQTFLSSVTGFDIDTGEQVWKLDGLDDVTGYVTHGGTPGVNDPALVLFEQNPDEQRAGLRSVQLFDPDTGEALTPRQPITGTMEGSGLQLDGRVALIVSDGEVRSLDGTVIAEYSGEASTFMRDSVLVVSADEVHVISW